MSENINKETKNDKAILTDQVYYSAITARCPKCDTKIHLMTNGRFYCTKCGYTWEPEHR